LFPVTPGYRGLIPPTRVWAEIAREFKTRYINEALHIYWHDQQFSLSRPTSRIDDAYGGMLEAESIVNNDMEFFRKPQRHLRSWPSSTPAQPSIRGAASAGNGRG